MYRIVTPETDKDLLLKFWRDEQATSPLYRELNHTDDSTDESFFTFCAKHQIYEIDGKALLFLERTQNIVEIHFSILRRQKCENLMVDLASIRNQLFREGVDIVFGWVLKANVPLKCVCKTLGLYFNGTEHPVERKGRKPFILQCFAIHKNDLLLEIPNTSL